MQELSKILERLAAGRHSFTNNELESIIIQFADKFYDSPNMYLEESDTPTLQIINKILDSVLENHLLEIFVKYTAVNKLKAITEILVGKPEYNSDQSLFAQHILNLVKQTKILREIKENIFWQSAIPVLIRKSNFNLRALLKQRRIQYRHKTLYGIIKSKNIKKIFWDEAVTIIEKYGAGLLGVLSDKESIVAFLSDNSPEMAMLDLACLSSGIKNVMIPANSVPQHISYIIKETGAEVIILSGEKQLAKLKSIKKEIPSVKTAILIEGTSAETWVYDLDEMQKAGNFAEYEQNIIPRDIDELATVMYTSGTTGNPKGIMFSQMNIISKRFLRAMALPEIGDKDRFLCYLPLFHTFGRYLEMMGTIFWGAEYYFMENPSLKTMLLNMSMVKPTVFISIPKKWIQLHEHVSSKIDIEFGSHEEIKAALDEATGGELRWGLSAAGYLDPLIFRFFQKYGVELMSGFGMTEATGGITMTPPGKYKENSLGCALPGIAIKVAKDGELLVKGEYVMLGYYGSSDGAEFDNEGYFPTGDIMRMDDNGFIEILDRKKDIYKNVRGETIAPQKIENLFSDFDYVKQVFLVGDGKPYNTVLIYPDYNDEDCVLKTMSGEQIHDYFSTVIVTVNNFLAPFERILDFKLINRGFSEEFGEVTPKGTFRRKVIEANFEDSIKALYVKPHYDIALQNVQIRIPNWFLRELGCLYRDISTDGSNIIINKLNKKLRIMQCSDDNSYVLGNFCYKAKNRVFELQPFITNPILWAGNKELFDFVGDQILQWTRHIKTDGSYQISSVNITEKNLDNVALKLESLKENREQSFYGIHLAAVLLYSGNPAYCELSTNYLDYIASNNVHKYSQLVKSIIFNPQLVKPLSARKKLLLSALKNYREIFLDEILITYTDHDPLILDNEIINRLIKDCDLKSNISKIVNPMMDAASKYSKEKQNESSLAPYLALLANFGKTHPTYYEKLRQIFVGIQLGDNEDASELASQYRRELREAFRGWLGENQQIAVDIETGEEYSWSDVIIFDEEVTEEDKKRISDSLTYTPVLREAIFLFSGGKRIMLDNIPPSGLWISLHREYSQKIVYKVVVQTRTHGSYEILLNLNKDREHSVLPEINWLILAGSRYYMQELIEDFGGYWDQYDVWSARYVPGNNVANLIQREVNKKDTSYTRLFHLWPFFVWNASAAYFNFWKLTGHRYMLIDTSPDNYIIPSHDYQGGTKVISLSEHKSFTNFHELFNNFFEQFVKEFEEKYTFLKRHNVYDYIFAGFVNTEGEEAGMNFLTNLLHEEEMNENKDEQFVTHLQRFIDFVEDKSFIPKQLYFAIQRFQRWENINKDASDGAKAQMLHDLFTTYQLDFLDKIKPETRARFFFETVFIKSNTEFKEAFKKIYLSVSKGSINIDEAHAAYTELMETFELSKQEKFFLTRLSYPHIKPSDSAVIIRSVEEGKELPNLVVEYNDHEGNPFFIRKPISPKEISRLHQLFIETNMMVNFHDEHQYLVAISERGFIIGGLFYTFTDKETIFMDKIVVSNRYRRKGISEKLMEELFERIKNENVRFVTTGFFRPEYFYRFGFSVEKKYSGLVKDLKELPQIT